MRCFYFFIFTTPTLFSLFFFFPTPSQALPPLPRPPFARQKSKRVDWSILVQSLSYRSVARVAAPRNALRHFPGWRRLQARGVDLSQTRKTAPSFLDFTLSLLPSISLPFPPFLTVYLLPFASSSSWLVALPISLPLTLFILLPTLSCPPPYPRPELLLSQQASPLLPSYLSSSHLLATFCSSLL